MLETKSLLEQKGASLTARADMVDDLQTELASLRAQVESLTQEKEMSGEREGELTGRVTHLELDNKHWYRHTHTLLPPPFSHLCLTLALWYMHICTYSHFIILYTHTHYVQSGAD